MTRAQTFLWFSRCCLTVVGLTVAVLVFGPFGGAEQSFGLTDKEAHAIAFYTLTTLGLMAMPSVRKWDIALGCLAIGGAIEIVQAFIGRDGDIFDWLVDGVGVTMAVVPMLFENARCSLRGELMTVPRRRASDQTVNYRGARGRQRSAEGDTERRAPL